jgi:Predicted permease
MRATHALALALAGSMTWEILWALILGFAASAIVQALVRRETITLLLGDDRPKALAIAAGLGAASSSCSYAAVALARSLFRKGASFIAAHPGAAARLAVHPGGIRRRSAHDRVPCRPWPLPRIHRTFAILPCVRRTPDTSDP